MMKMNRYTRITLALIRPLVGCSTGEIDGEALGEDGIAETEAAVVGGTTEPDYWHPWIVTTQAGYTCRGVLIHPRWVLTAAHCVDGSNWPSVSWSRTDPATGQRYSGENSATYLVKHMHPDYNPATFAHDIALIDLKTPFTLGRYLQTVALPRSPAQVGHVGKVANYSHSETLPTGIDAILRASIAVLWPSSGLFEVRDDGASLCSGDSGSGFVRIVNGRATVQGIASYSSTSCNSGALGLNAGMADVYAHRGWILSTLGMTQAELDGRSRLRMSGRVSTGVMKLGCVGTSVSNVEGPMVPGVELRLPACGTWSVTTASCDLSSAATDLQFSAFTLRSTTSTGTSTTSLPYQPRWASYLSSLSGSPPVPIRELTCAVSRFGIAPAPSTVLAF
jgi:secreted trypsin-like serine protease